MLAFILNFPYTLAGLITALLSGPRSVTFRKNPHAFVFHIRSFWWAMGYMKNARAVVIGHAVLLGPQLEPFDLKHELIHVEQYTRLPVIFPVLYYLEVLQKGYRKSKYEDEAYTRAGNIYKGK